MSPPPLSRTEQNFVTVISHLKYKFLNGFRGYPLPSPLPHACLLHFYSTSVTCSHLRLHLSCSTAKRVALPFSVSFIWNDLNCVTGCLQVNKKWNSNIKSYFNEIVVHCVLCKSLDPLFPLTEWLKGKVSAAYNWHNFSSKASSEEKYPPKCKPSDIKEWEKTTFLVAFMSPVICHKGVTLLKQVRLMENSWITFGVKLKQHLAGTPQNPHHLQKKRDYLQAPCGFHTFWRPSRPMS